jgi:hypothetical protein
MVVHEMVLSVKKPQHELQALLNTLYLGDDAILEKNEMSETNLNHLKTDTYL